MILREATDITASARPWAFTRSAREAWGVILDAVKTKLGEGQEILLPAYIGVSEREGSGLYDPVLASGIAHRFYSVGPKLEVDPVQLDGLLASGRHPLVLVVHYFGLMHGDMAALRKMCDRHGAILIEDCAHVPGPGVMGAGGPGTWGDASFFSLHKMLPCEDGGVLAVGPGTKLQLDLPTDDQVSLGALTAFARADWKGIAERRKANYAWLVDRLKNVDGIEVLYPEIGDCVPHDFPLRILNGLREKLYFRLMDRHMPTTALYYKMVDNIGQDEFPGSHDLSLSILNLPVHQDTDRHDLERLCGALEECLVQLRMHG